MIEVRQLHLKTHGVVDTIDSMVKNCALFCRIWKHWHSPMRLGKSAGMCVACDMHLECAKGNLNPNWKTDDLVDFHQFHEKLALQTLHCNPWHLNCPGDEFFQMSTQQPKSNDLHRDHGHSCLSPVPGGRSSLSRARGAMQSLFTSCTTLLISDTSDSRICPWGAVHTCWAQQA